MIKTRRRGNMKHEWRATAATGKRAEEGRKEEEKRGKTCSRALLKQKGYNLVVNEKSKKNTQPVHRLITVNGREEEENITFQWESMQMTVAVAVAAKRL